MYAQIVRWFCDSSSPNCPFSIHNLIAAGACFKKPVGTWFGPNETSHMIQQCLNKRLTSMSCVIADNSVLYLDKILDTCRIQRANQGQTAPWNEGHGILLLVPTKLGVSELNQRYMPAIKKVLTLRWSVGIVGGKPNRSLYFLGFQDDRLIYLDPHTVQESQPVGTEFNASSETYHFKGVQSIHCSEMDTSMAIGFYCRDRKDFNDFWAAAKVNTSQNYSIFGIADKTPSYGDCDMKENDTHHPANDGDSDDWELL